VVGGVSVFLGVGLGMFVAVLLGVMVGGLVVVGVVVVVFVALGVFVGVLLGFAVVGFNAVGVYVGSTVLLSGVSSGSGRCSVGVAVTVMVIEFSGLETNQSVRHIAVNPSVIRAIGSKCFLFITSFLLLHRLDHQ